MKTSNIPNNMIHTPTAQATCCNNGATSPLSYPLLKKSGAYLKRLAGMLRLFGKKGYKLPHHCGSVLRTTPPRIKVKSRLACLVFTEQLYAIANARFSHYSY